MGATECPNSSSWLTTRASGLSACAYGLTMFQAAALRIAVGLVPPIASPVYMYVRPERMHVSTAGVSSQAGFVPSASSYLYADAPTTMSGNPPPLRSPRVTLTDDGVGHK